MRLTVEKLHAHLQRQGLARVYCLSGDEPLQLLEAEDAIRRRAREEGVEERITYRVERGFDWQQLLEEGGNLSLFSSRRLLELKLGTSKPGRAGGQALLQWLEGGGEDTLLITAARLDRQAQQARWYKAVDQAGVVTPVWPVEPGRLPDWLRRRMRSMGRDLDRQAAELIAERTEGNLLAARQELEKLCLLVDKPAIGPDDVLQAVVDSARFDAFALVEAALRGDMDRTAAMLRGLRREGAEPLALFGALMWEFRRLCAMAAAMARGASMEQAFREFRVWQQRQPALTAALRRFTAEELSHLLIAAGRVDRALKGAARREPWQSLEDFLSLIAGVRLQSAVSLD